MRQIVALITTCLKFSVAQFNYRIIGMSQQQSPKGLTANFASLVATRAAISSSLVVQLFVFAMRNVTQSPCWMYISVHML